jgi:hypothetical protein
MRLPDRQRCELQVRNDEWMVCQIAMSSDLIRFTPADFMSVQALAAAANQLVRRR